MKLSTCTRGRLTSLVAVPLVATALAAGLLVRTDADLDGRDEASLAQQHVSPQGVEAYFLRESYEPGTRATLVVPDGITGLSLQIFRAGSEPQGQPRRYELYGAPVTFPIRLALGVRSAAQHRAGVLVGNWSSGLYYARLVAPDGAIGYATFIVRPRRLGEHRVAVVLPTNTWQAYNRRDGDGDGDGDTWYESWSIKSVDMTRAFLDRGVPPHFGHYDRPFLQWLTRMAKQADFLSDRDLEETRSGDELASAYDLIVFPGHHEYVTTHEYDIIERFRDLGGNLMFLSANNFFWRVVKRGDAMTRTAQWRDLGRPESALIGVQYIGNDEGEHRGGYVLRSAPAASWIFDGIPHDPGPTFGDFGIEIDATTPASPAGTQVIAEIPNLFGSNSAQMTYYETKAGAKVFAAGAFTLAGGALSPAIARVLENLWTHLSQP